MKDGVVSLSVSREDRNIFIDGLPGRIESLQVVPNLSKEDLAVDEGKVAYVQVALYGRHGLKVWLRRLKDDAMLFCWSLTSSSGKISYNPWQHLQPLNAQV